MCAYSVFHEIVRDGIDIENKNKAYHCANPHSVLNLNAQIQRSISCLILSNEIKDIEIVIHLETPPKYNYI